MDKKEAYEKKLQGQLNEWRAEIDKLKARADTAEGEAQLEYYRQIEDVRSRHEEASAKLEELKTASNESWEDLKAGLDSAWDSLSQSVKSAASRFK